MNFSMSNYLDLVISHEFALLAGLELKEITKNIEERIMIDPKVLKQERNLWNDF